MIYTEAQIEQLLNEEYPIDNSAHRFITIDPSQIRLTSEQRSQLLTNIELGRKNIAFFTTLAGAKGVGAHSGRAFDMVPEWELMVGFINGWNQKKVEDPWGDVPYSSFKIHEYVGDEAGHGVAIQYWMMALKKLIWFQHLLHYREGGWGLPGHPEKGVTPGIPFSTGRLNHFTAYLNGYSEVHPAEIILMPGSDGSQEGGINAEASMLAVERWLPVKWFIDCNNVTIEGHPLDVIKDNKTIEKGYIRNWNLEARLRATGMGVSVCHNAEDTDELFSTMLRAIITPGPYATLHNRNMAPGTGVEGSNKGHDVFAVNVGVKYLQDRGETKAVEMLKSAKKIDTVTLTSPSLGDYGNPRDFFGEVMCDIMSRYDSKERLRKFRFISPDLGGSVGFHHIKKHYPELYVHPGIAERSGFSFAAGWASSPERQAYFGTFGAFQEMIISEITMARLNGLPVRGGFPPIGAINQEIDKKKLLELINQFMNELKEANVLCYFPHASFAWMADNDCHAAINNFFADNGIPEGDNTRLYMPASKYHLKSLLEAVHNDLGLRFVYGVREPLPEILDENGNPFYKDRKFVKDKDEIIRTGKDGYIVTYGEMLHRSLVAVEEFNKENNCKIGVINKPTLNVVDEEIMRTVLDESPFVLVVEGQNEKTGLGVRFGSWMYRRGFKNPEYDYIGITKHGITGLASQMAHQGLDPAGIKIKLKGIYNRSKAA